MIIFLKIVLISIVSIVLIEKILDLFEVYGILRFALWIAGLAATYFGIVALAPTF